MPTRDDLACARGGSEGEPASATRILRLGEWRDRERLHARGCEGRLPRMHLARLRTRPVPAIPDATTSLRLLNSRLPSGLSHPGLSSSESSSVRRTASLRSMTPAATAVTMETTGIR